MVIRAVRIAFWLLATTVGLATWLLVAWQVIVAGLFRGPQSLLIVAVAGLVTAWLMLLVHELGHHLAGRFAGLPPLTLTAGFLRFEWHDGRAKPVLNTQLFRHAAVVEHDVSKASPRRHATFVAGGPAASILAGVVCLAVAQAMNPEPPQGSPAARDKLWMPALILPGSDVVSWLNASGLVSLLLAGGSLIPGRVRGLPTDGAQLLFFALQATTAQATGLTPPPPNDGHQEGSPA